MHIGVQLLKLNPMTILVGLGCANASVKTAFLCGSEFRFVMGFFLIIYLDIEKSRFRKKREGAEPLLSHD
ncbi:hypothetical protein AMJ83_07655 [candidate division WOR_3 bacterium SM23_42]|uniref:Uncharacterized protein n=1 Tax=candidate division WOR_3 bacterium SM23_42 TaxID=1703779 RepID=A0A0S8FR54_UNCW3|nr:MAG: hypothetical protein AMJ83_07655 [candidate division WOR_3 bacterium SM23_42]